MNAEAGKVDELTSVLSAIVQSPQMTQLVIDQEVTRILTEAAERARAILSARRAALDATIDLLLEKETISGQELMDVVRRPPASVRPVAAVG